MIEWSGDKERRARAEEVAEPVASRGTKAACWEEREDMPKVSLLFALVDQRTLLLLFAGCVHVSLKKQPPSLFSPKHKLF